MVRFFLSITYAYNKPDPEEFMMHFWKYDMDRRLTSNAMIAADGMDIDNICIDIVYKMWAKKKTRNINKKF